MAKGKRDLELMVERGDVSVSCGPKANCRHKDIGGGSCVKCSLVKSACKVLFSHQDLAQPNSL